MKVKRQNGISLIEILVVIALLLLVLIAIFRSFRTDISRTQDAQRKTDLRNIKIAFEDYHTDKGTYPPEEVLLACDSTEFRPYLREVPCDPATGEPYLYMPFPGNGDNSRGYRILTILADKADPVIKELGCELGCGVPSDHPRYSSSANYVYGVAEGVPLVLEGYIPPAAVPTSAATPAPTASPGYCASNPCYCCANSAYVSSQDCNLWQPGNNCDIGPYASTASCYASSPCQAQ